MRHAFKSGKPIADRARGQHEQPRQFGEFADDAFAEQIERFHVIAQPEQSFRLRKRVAQFAVIACGLPEGELFQRQAAPAAQQHGILPQRDEHRQQAVGTTGFDMREIAQQRRFARTRRAENHQAAIG